jgi:hypothetical protein
VIRLSRAGGLRPPLFCEVLAVRDDGSFDLWRSVSMASTPLSPIGRFGGTVDEAARAELSDTAERAAAEGSRSWTVTPDSPVDTIDVGDVRAVLGLHDDGEGAWKDLAALVRPLLADLTSSPLGAIGLTVDGEPALEHLGTEPLRLDLSGLTVRADHWRDGGSEARWSSTDAGQGEVEATPGWRLVLPFDHGFDLRPDDHVTVQVTFAAHDGDRLVPVSLQSP